MSPRDNFHPEIIRVRVAPTVHRGAVPRGDGVWHLVMIRLLSLKSVLSKAAAATLPKAVSLETCG